MFVADAPQEPALWLPPKPAIIRPAEHSLLKPGAFRPMTREERRAVLSDLVRARRLTPDEARRAILFVPAAIWAKEASAAAVVTRATFIDTTASTPEAVTLPASIVAGNLLLMTCSPNANTSVSTPSGWSLLTNSANNYYIFNKTATGSEGATVSVTTGTGVQFAALTYQISGWSTTPAFGTTATGSSSSPAPPSLSLTSGNYLVLVFAGSELTPSGTTVSVSSYPSGYSNGQTAASSSGSHRPWDAGAEAQFTSITSVSPGAFAISSSVGWWAQAVAVS